MNFEMKALEEIKDQKLMVPKGRHLYGAAYGLEGLFLSDSQTLM